MEIRYYLLSHVDPTGPALEKLLDLDDSFDLTRADDFAAIRSFLLRKHPGFDIGSIEPSFTRRGFAVN